MYLKLPGIYDEERNATGYVVQSAGPIPLALEWLSRRYNFTWKWLDNNQFIVKPYEITQILIALKAIHSFNIYTYNIFSLLFCKLLFYSFRYSYIPVMGPIFVEDLPNQRGGISILRQGVINYYFELAKLQHDFYLSGNSEYQTYKFVNFNIVSISGGWSIGWCCNCHTKPF